MISRTKLTDLSADISSTIDLFVCAASFERRCLSIGSALASRTKRAIIVRNREFTHTSEVHYRSLLELFGERTSSVMVSTNAPTMTADAFTCDVIPYIREIQRGGNVFVDITTFTHEQLCIFIALLSGMQHSCDLRFGYTGASEYSTNTDEDGVWLSRGVRQVRSILGYPGDLAPSRKLHLIVLLGFESQRARLLIEMMEPSMLSLGVGGSQTSVSSHHYARNERFVARLDSFLKTQDQLQAEVRRFNFSCINPFDACGEVLREASLYTDYNTVVCPMNTKLSTFGTGLAALRNPRLQLVYASPEEYNEEGYSTPGEDATIFSLDFPQND